MKRNLLLRGIFSSMMLLMAGWAAAQTTFADWRVYVYDNESKKVADAEVSMWRDGILKESKLTDSSGYVVFQTLDPGLYSMVIKKQGYQTDSTVEIELRPGNNPEQKKTLALIGSTKVVGTAIVTVSKRQVINLDENKKGVSGDQLVTAAGRGTDYITKTNSNVNNTAQGISIRGSRSDANATFIDGQRAIGFGTTTTLGTEQLQVTTGGVPAMFGDFTGGAFQYTTRGPSRKFVGALEGITSTGLDPYGSNSLEGFLAGPLWIKDKGGKNEYVKLGFSITGNLGYFKDPSPSFTGVYVVNENKLREIEQTPLLFTPNGFVHSASYLRSNDLTRLKAKPNSPLYQGTFQAKLEFQPTKLTNLTAWGSYYYGNQLAGTNSILNFNANNRSDRYTARTYLRFIQRFEPDKNSSIKSAYYTIRADYQWAYTETRDAVHLDNIFDYGYIGTFRKYPSEVFQFSHYDQSTNPNRQPKEVVDQYGNKVKIRDYWELVGYSDTQMTFQASDKNPLRARYTQNVYDYYASRGFRVNNENTLLTSLGLLNGYNPSSIYSLWTVPGTTTSNWSKSQTERYSLFAVGEMQVKPKSYKDGDNTIERAPHDLQAGLYYEQEINRGYGLNANGLWILMRQLMNSHIAELDKENPILSYDANGVFTDTVRYNRLVNYGQQSRFDRAFREKLISQGATDVYGRPVTQQTFVDINSYQPGDFSLDMFNADELLNNGNNYASWYGYDHLGNKVKGKPAIEQFLFDRDRRTIGAFQPIYMAAWVQDQFRFKDLTFRFGLRMERYDANQPVLRDPYSLFPIKTAGEVTEMNGVSVSHPSNISSDARVYVNDIKSPSRILGYRDGDRWYDATGAELRNPEVLANRTSNGRIAPYLVDPNNQELGKEAFKDYQPIVNVLPRVWFTFPLERGKKIFYVSYDVLAQRPNSGASFLTIDELYYLRNRQGSTISNGDLKPRTKTDYEVGYKQIFNKGKAGLELTAAYSEIRNDFGLYQINQGYPVTYITYRNIDFATITSFRAELTLQEMGPMSILASYMLQFADGTGSNINSQAALIASNQPNLRNVIPLGELDIRHNLKGMINFDFGGGKDVRTKKNLYKGPIFNGKEIFRYATFSFIGNAYSGAPYTPTTLPYQLGTVDRAPIKGVPFGARLPWQFTLDFNITKGFKINRSDKNPLLCNAFLWVTNVLNTRNIVNVFRYTGQPDDDGFLNSPQGQLAVQNQIAAQSYVDLYRVLLNSQGGNFGTPRTIRVGLRMNFN